MIVIRDELRPLKGLQVWFPESPDQLYPLLSAASVVTVMQCTDDVAQSLRMLAFRCKPFHTFLIDLMSSEQALWRGVHSKYLVNRAKRMDPEILVNEQPHEVLQLINQFIARKRFRSAVTPEAWSKLLAHCDVFQIRHEGRPVAGQVVLRNPPWRARLVFDATIDREDPSNRRAVFPLHTLLFWFVINHYRAHQFRSYDVGGVALNRDSPFYSISRFKTSFGGALATEYILRLARNPLLRCALRGVVSGRRIWGVVREDLAGRWRAAL